jgi:hypothetical protein
MDAAGFYHEKELAYFGIELFLYNAGNQVGGIFLMEFYKNEKGGFRIHEATYHPLFPADFHNLKPVAITRKIVLTAFGLFIVCSAVKLIFYVFKEVRESIKNKSL